MLILVPYRGFWNSPALSLLEEGEKFFLLLFNYIISNFFYIVKRVREPRPGFQRNPVAYGLFQALGTPGGPGSIRLENFPFSGKFYLVSRARKARFLFRMVPAFGRTAPRAPGRPAFNEKRAHMGLFLDSASPLTPKCYKIVTKMTKLLRNCYKNLIFFNENLIFDMCFLTKIQPFCTKMMENYGKFTKFTLDKAFIL